MKRFRRVLSPVGDDDGARGSAGDVRRGDELTLKAVQQFSAALVVHVDHLPHIVADQDVSLVVFRNSARVLQVLDKIAHKSPVFVEQFDATQGAVTDQDGVGLV